MTQNNIPDEAVRAVQNFLIQRDLRVPYDTVLGALQMAGPALSAQTLVDAAEHISPEREELSTDPYEAGEQNAADTLRLLARKAGVTT